MLWTALSACVTGALLSDKPVFVTHLVLKAFSYSKYSNNNTQKTKLPTETFSN